MEPPWRPRPLNGTAEGGAAARRPPDRLSGPSTPTIGWQAPRELPARDRHRSGCAPIARSALVDYALICSQRPTKWQSTLMCPSPWCSVKDAFGSTSARYLL